MSETAKLKESLWNDVTTESSKRGYISTTRGKAKAKVEGIFRSEILLSIFRNNEKRMFKIYRRDFDQAIDVLESKGRVRQGEISNKDRRYVIGAMTIFVNNYFTYTDEMDSDGKNHPFLRWSAYGKENLLMRKRATHE
ncbi:hypothetical protein CVD28_25725 [Bacillus sp. M6-12]|uniref:hypothetical protein n=1 Tax=Bacillus sp. M6-12 TaxID=2054166 RepID=UPI000C77138A|nr:hypothetical protein [Bacillus sp. M6-12]PLS14920.1 hypothetical protein CVD28_25725 [Bacillus sp. M6-12]